MFFCPFGFKMFCKKWIWLHYVIIKPLLFSISNGFLAIIFAGDLFHQFSSKILAFSGRRHTIFHPGWFGGSLHIEVEELLEADAEVLAVATLHEIVLLLVVFQHPNFLAQSSQRHEVLDALIPWHGSIVVIVHDEEWSGHFVGLKERRVLQIEVKTAFVP